MLGQGWHMVSTPFMFTIRLKNLESDEQAIERVTDQLNRALEVAEIEDWGADCFIQSRSRQSSNSRLTPS